MASVLGVDGGRLDDVVAFVTGAASGIGRAMCEEFAARGASIVACDIDGDGAEATRASVAGIGAPRALALTADVSRSADVERVVTAAQDELGRIDVLCANAGILDGYASAVDADEELWDRVMAVNLKAPWLLARAALPAMVARGDGCIVITASVAGLVAGGGGVSYTASKHGAIGLMRQIALENAAKGIRVNAICPGVVQTGMTQPLFDDPDSKMYEYIPAIPSATWAQPQEIAKLAALMAAGEVPFMHGAAVVADGGWTIQ